MTGKEFKDKVVSRIPDGAEIVVFSGRYIAWRRPDGRISCYSFHPERFLEDINDIKDKE